MLYKMKGLELRKIVCAVCACVCTRKGKVKEIKLKVELALETVSHSCEEQALAEGSASSAAGRAMVAYSMTCDLSKCLCSWNVVSTRMEVPAKGHSNV